MLFSVSGAMSPLAAGLASAGASQPPEWNELPCASDFPGSGALVFSADQGKEGPWGHALCCFVCFIFSGVGGQILSAGDRVAGLGVASEASLAVGMHVSDPEITHASPSSGLGGGVLCIGC